MVPWQSCLNRNELHRLLCVQIDGAIEADRVFTMLMGDEGDRYRGTGHNTGCKICLLRTLRH
jgi:DNA gyrase/topoisomerase IV subunit B